MSLPRSATLLTAATLVALGLIVGGGFVGSGFRDARLGDRFVTVKGVSERDVRADLAIWPLTITVAGDDLAASQRALTADVERTLSFLDARGLPRPSAAVQPVRVTDAAANPYRDAPPTTRFVLTQTVVVRTEDVEAVAAATEEVGALVGEGVVLQSGPEYGPTGPTFLFKGLSELKPEMIGEATARAREAATEFADDSGSRLGGIRRANQGVFQILPRDRAPGMQASQQMDKTVRVVSTIEYYLRD